MTAELVMGLVTLLLALIGGGTGIVRSVQRGRTDEKLNQAERERDAEKAKSAALGMAPASPTEAAEILRRNLARLSRRLHERTDRRE